MYLATKLLHFFQLRKHLKKKIRLCLYISFFFRNFAADLITRFV